MDGVVILDVVLEGLTDRNHRNQLGDLTFTNFRSTYRSCDTVLTRVILRGLSNATGIVSPKSVMSTTGFICCRTSSRLSYSASDSQTTDKVNSSPLMASVM